MSMAICTYKQTSGEFLGAVACGLALFINPTRQHSAAPTRGRKAFAVPLMRISGDMTESLRGMQPTVSGGQDQCPASDLKQ